MFKVIHLICLGLFLFPSCKKNKSSWKKHNLSGEVEYYREKRYSESENLKVVLIDEIKVRYNKEGEWISSENFVNGKIEVTIVPEYNERELIEINYYDSENKLMEKSRITHVSDSLEVMETFGSNKEVQSRIFSLLREELLFEINYRNFSNGVLVNKSKSFYEYDSRRNCVLIKVVDSDNKLIMIKRWKYVSFDRVGNWTKKLEFNSADTDVPSFSIERDLKYYSK